MRLGARAARWSLVLAQRPRQNDRIFTLRVVRVEARTLETNRATLGKGGRSELGGIIYSKVLALELVRKVAVHGQVPLNGSQGGEKRGDELRRLMLVRIDDGNGFSNGLVEILDRDLILSHARLCTILDG